MSPSYSSGSERNSGLLTALVAGALIALVGANIYLYVQIDHVQTDLKTMHDDMAKQILNVRDASSVSTAAAARHIEAMKAELEQARQQARSLSSEAKVEAQAHADELAKRIQAEEARVNTQVNSQIHDVQQSASAANAKIADVSTDVGSVKTQVTQTQSELDKTITELKSVRGDMGVQSGLIATNGNELAALKLRGERNYIDIKLGKTKAPQRFGDIMLKLENANPKKHTYSVTVTADDVPTAKKDKGVNEPVQFYTSKGGHIPYELVINSVGKDQIVGYLSTPKEVASR